VKREKPRFHRTTKKRGFKGIVRREGASVGTHERKGQMGGTAEKKAGLVHGKASQSVKKVKNSKEPGWEKKLKVGAFPSKIPQGPAIRRQGKSKSERTPLISAGTWELWVGKRKASGKFSQEFRDAFGGGGKVDSTHNGRKEEAVRGGGGIPEGTRGVKNVKFPPKGGLRLELIPLKRGQRKRIRGEIAVGKWRN